MDPKVIFLLAMIYASANANPIKEDVQFLRTVLENVPEEDRRQFLIHQLYLGYILRHPDDVIVHVPTDVTLQLYEIFLRNFVKSPVDEQLMAMVCFPDGECVDTEDPAVIP